MDLKTAKERLINSLINDGYLKRPDVIEAFRKVPREEFVLERYREHSYDNIPLPILEDQTISQPLTVAVMTEALQPRIGQKILEVGAGSGYQAAILAEIVGKSGRIITTDRVRGLVDFAWKNLKKAGYSNVTVVEWDGSEGYDKEAPYDRIIVTASAPEIPRPLIDQLKKNGRLVIPVRDEMFLVEKNKEMKKTLLGYYVFVPLVGKYGYRG
jgi:protein-L-isoaspartate(D-aspartate) O-methyltransferase